MADHRQQVVLVTGVFDCLHQEHLNFLRKAQACGDSLIVGIESDVRVRQLKGQSRPVQDQVTRLKALQATGLVDQAFILPEKFNSPQDHEQLIKDLRPSILAVSSHTPNLEAKRRIMAKYGGEVGVVHQHNPLVSTSLFVSEIK